MFKLRRHTIISLLLFGTAFNAGAEEWGLCHTWTPPVFDYPRPERGEDAPIILSADSSESQDNQVLKLYGNVLVQRPEEQLHADEAIFYRDTETLEASGNVRYDTPNFSTLSSQARVVSGTEQGSFEDAEFFIYERHARGSSRSIQQQGKDLTVLKQTSYTTCDKEDEDWALKASTVELDHDSGMGTTYNTRLHFQGVPIFYLPYLTFPITDARMTGLLAPSWGSSGENGNDFALPIYLNLHPQLDATITPHNYTARGLMWENELRYLSRFGEGTIDTKNIDDELYGQERSLYHFDHKSQLGSWTGNILFDRASDADYFDDFGNSLSSSATRYLERHVKLQYSDSLQQLLIQTQDYQIINPTLAPGNRPYRRLPQIKHKLSPGAMGPLQFSLDSEIVRFQQQDRLNGSRANLNPALSLPYQRTAGYITPKLSLHQTYYELDEPYNNQESISRTVPVNSIDAGIFLERDATIGATQYLHTLEPRLFYVYIPYRDQSDVPVFDSGSYGFSQAQLYRENRFSGVDRIGDTEQVTVSLASRLLRASDGSQKLYGSLGKIVYLEDRQVGINGNILDTDHQSDIIAEAQFDPNDRVSLKATLLWDTEYDLITERDVRFQYMSDNYHIINFRYRDRGNRITAPASVLKEIDSSLLWPLSTHWSMMMRRYHSLSDNRTQEKMLGLEYNSCCWAFRAVRRAEYVSNTPNQLDYGWYMQLEMKGLTSLGKRIDELMQEQILGFKAVN